MNTYFTAVPNELLEMLYRSYLSGSEMRVMLLILRRTVGFHRSSSELSLSDIMSETGIDRGNASRCLRGIEEEGFIRIRTQTGSSPQVVELICCQEDNSGAPDCCQEDNSSSCQDNNTADVRETAIPYKENIKENSKERKKTAPFISDEDMQELIEDYGKSYAEEYAEKVRLWAKSKGVRLSEPVLTVRRWLEQDGCKKPDFDVSKYEFLINNF